MWWYLFLWDAKQREVVHAEKCKGVGDYVGRLWSICREITRLNLGKRVEISVINAKRGFQLARETVDQIGKLALEREAEA